jgi:hypothetical protein
MEQHTAEIRFSTGERARLDFVRWLRQTGRI